MAGLALLGDLTDIAYQRNVSIDVHHALSSIKIYEDGYTTPKEFYGAVIEDAIDKASNMKASIQCYGYYRRKLIQWNSHFKFSGT